MTPFLKKLLLSKQAMNNYILLAIIIVAFILSSIYLKVALCIFTFLYVLITSSHYNSFLYKLYNSLNSQQVYTMFQYENIEYLIFRSIEQNNKLTIIPHKGKYFNTTDYIGQGYTKPQVIDKIIIDIKKYKDNEKGDNYFIIKDK